MYNHFRLRLYQGYVPVTDAPSNLQEVVDKIAEGMDYAHLPAIQVTIARKYYLCILKSQVYIESQKRNSLYLHAFIIEKNNLNHLITGKNFSDNLIAEKIAAAFPEVYGKDLQKSIEEICNKLGNKDLNEEVRQSLHKFDIRLASIKEENQIPKGIYFGVKDLSQNFKPKPITPESITSELITSEPITSEPITPEPIASKPITPEILSIKWFFLPPAILIILLLLINTLFQYMTLQEVQLIGIIVGSTESPNSTEISKTPDTYAKLEEYLKSGKFKKADEETRKSIYFLSEKTKEDWAKENIKYIDANVFNKLDCSHIIELDKLWAKYSKEDSEEKFGFSVQNKIWINVNEKIESFGTKVGWRKNNKWLKIGELTYSLTKAEKGHLPSRSPGSDENPLSGGWLILSLLNSQNAHCLNQVDN